MNATIRARNMMELLQDLVAVLDKETALLDRPRPSELEPVVEEKQALFKLYEDHIAALSQDPGFAAALDDDLRQQLTALAETFETAMEKNRRKLELMTRSSQHIVNRIVEAAKDAAGQVPGYSRGGNAYQGRAAAPVAMNQEV